VAPYCIFVVASADFSAAGAVAAHPLIMQSNRPRVIVPHKASIARIVDMSSSFRRIVSVSFLSQRQFDRDRLSISIGSGH
jgi:hypothetical protein